LEKEVSPEEKKGKKYEVSNKLTRTGQPAFHFI
jgi:hypothetical protein